ncbi:NIMA-related kinase 4 [Striga asiatica]|uniref:NIMA-related kinase 4 n=1 Tax=Striga asiatica TaxID=4170 RepID=A0A5A7PQL8_STRAF|nr:NIMA-related kinase 4 [Striga asiatica]
MVFSGYLLSLDREREVQMSESISSATSFIDGLFCRFSSRHPTARNASAFIVSTWSSPAPSLSPGSIASMTLSSSTSLLTYIAKFTSSGSLQKSIALWAVKSSNKTTPKLYTSLLSVNWYPSVPCAHVVTWLTSACASLDSPKSETFPLSFSSNLRDRGRVEVCEPVGRVPRNAQAAGPGEEPAAGGVREVVREGTIGDVLVDKKGLVELDAAAEEADEAAVVDLAEYADLVQELVGALGVAELGALDGDCCGGGGGGGGVVEEEDGAVDLAVAAGAEEVVAGEVVGSTFDLFAGEEFGGGAAGVEDELALAGDAVLLVADASVAFVGEECDEG